MAVKFPDLYFEWSDGSSRQVTPGTTTGTYTITNDATSSGTIVENADNTFTLTLNNLKAIRIVNISFPWQTNAEPLGGGGQGTTNIHFFPRLGGMKLLNGLLTDFGWASYFYPGQVVSPFVIRTNVTEARIMAATNWPPKKCSIQYSLNRNRIVYYNDHIEPASSGTFSCMYKLVSGTESISQPLWMQAMDYFKDWLDEKMTDYGIEPVSYPDWLRESHGFLDVQLQNYGTFDVNELEDTFDLWKGYLPWLQMWGQMSDSGGGCCFRDKTIHAHYTGLTTLSTNLVSQGYRVGFYTRVPDIIAEFANYQSLSSSATQKIDDTPTNIQSITDDSVQVFSNVIYSPSTTWSNTILAGDIVHLTKSGYSAYFTVEKVGSVALGDANYLYITVTESFNSGLDASVDRYSGGTENALQYIQDWISKANGGSFGGNAAYLDVLGNTTFDPPLVVADKFLSGEIDNDLFIESMIDVYPAAGLYSGAITANSMTIDSGSNNANISLNGTTATRSSGSFDPTIREWDTLFLGTSLLIVDSTSPARTNLTYTFSTTTTSGPSSGQVRLNNATYGSATTLYISETDSGATDRSAFWGGVAVNSIIRVYKASDITIYFDVRVTSNTDSGNYRTIGITPLTNRNTFTNGDTVTVEISPLITSITTKAASLVAQSNQSYTVTRFIGNPERTLSDVTTYADNGVTAVELVRYLHPKRLFFLGEVNNDFWFWGNLRGANYHVERQAFLLGMKFDAITPADTYLGTTINQVLGSVISLRNEHRWWNRNFEYKHQIGISNISNANVKIRRFTDADGYELFAVDNWDQNGSGTFDFNTTTYEFTNDKLQLIDTRPPDSDDSSSGSGSFSQSNIRTYTNISFANIAQARYTEIFSPFSSSGVVLYQFRRKDVPSDKFTIRSDINIKNYPQVKNINSTKIEIELPERTTYQIRMKQNNGEWTDWSDFTTRKIDYDYPDQNSKTKIKKSKRGEKIINTDTGFSTVKSIKTSKRGEVIDNTKIDYNK